MTPINIFETEYAAPKGYLTGTHRTRSPRQTLDDYARFMPLMGITRLANLTGLDHIGLPVYTAIRPNSRSLATSQGKGFDADSAKASALMESIETWHAERIAHPLKWDSYWSLAETAAVVNVTETPLLEGRELRLDYPCLWIEGRDLMQSQPVWVPYEAATLNCVLPPGYMATFCVSTNGLFEDDDEVAVIHGPEEFGYRQISEAMVNLRAGLQRAEAAGLISLATRQALLQETKRMFYPERSWPSLLECGAGLGLPENELAALRDFVRRENPNVKRDDATELLRLVAAECAAGMSPHQPNFHFEPTDFWLKLGTLEALADDAQAPSDERRQDDDFQQDFFS